MDGFHLLQLQVRSESILAHMLRREQSVSPTILHKQPFEICGWFLRGSAFLW